jgi:hypothetical protein
LRQKGEVNGGVWLIRLNKPQRMICILEDKLNLEVKDLLILLLGLP